MTDGVGTNLILKMYSDDTCKPCALLEKASIPSIPEKAMKLKDKIKPTFPFEDKRTPSQNNSADALFRLNELAEQERIMIEAVRDKYNELKEKE